MFERYVIPRPDYFAALDRHRVSSDLIKIVTGVRRCGKSTLLRMYQEKLRSEGISGNQIIALNFEDVANRHLLDGDNLHEFVIAKTSKTGLNYVFLDEAQLVSGFGELINSLRMRENIDLYITGSNSSLLAGRLPKILGGRYIQIHMFPLSFREYTHAFSDSHAGIDEMFQQYLEYSSFPEVLIYRKNSANTGFAGSQWDRQGVHEYLSHIYESIIMRDVMQRDDVKELPQLTRVVNYLFCNIGSETSINNMVGVINNEFKLKPDCKTLYAPMLERYLAALLDSFIFYKSDRHCINGRELLRTNAKYYAVDVGLRYYLLGGTAVTDAGHLLENIVFLELLRRGYKVKTGRIGDKEIDFSVQKPGGQVEYYQVAQSVIDENTLLRELAPLQAIKDNYPKFILTRDFGHTTYKGIRQINVLEWLCEQPALQ